MLQVQRELNRSHWSKSARSFLCSDYSLAKKQRPWELLFFLLFPNISPLAACVYERDHTNA